MILAFFGIEVAQTAVRIGAAIVGALVGWFVTKPAANVLSRLAFQRPIANEIMPLVRVIGACGLAALCYFLVPAGIGSGSGGGAAGLEKDKASGKDKGGDRGTDKARDKEDKTGSHGRDKEKDTKTPPDLLLVEILGGKRYPGGDKWYLFQRDDPPLTRSELEARIAEHLKSNKLESARLQPYIARDTHVDWRSERMPELEQIRGKLGLQPVDPSTPETREGK